LPDSLLIPGTDSVRLDTTVLLRGVDFSTDYINGRLSLLRELAGDTLRISYQIFPLHLSRSYRRRQPLPVAENVALSSDSSTAPILVASSPLAPANRHDLGSNLRKSGSLIRGISVGSNQSLRVESGLRMQIAGQLSDDIEVIASLSDENTPIQPEGNTQTLREIDQVFVQVKAEHLQATLGDYQLDIGGNELTGYSRKLSGAMGQANYDRGAATVSAAVSRGQFATNEFLGQEGNQGPYLLQGNDGQINVIILAGTERVWIDGLAMTRGENHDYIIEYGNGQITFTRNRLITADSRIVIDFQYSDESFQRNFVSARGEYHVVKDKITVGSTFLREKDNADNPLSFTLSDAYRQALEESGDGAAIVSGDTFTGAGKGAYVKNSDSVYVYVGPGNGDRNVSFSYFGSNRGDYRNIGLGRYEYVGENLAGYRPFIILPKANQHNMLGLDLDVSPSAAMKISGEVALSDFDANLYSDRDNADNQGTAYNIKLNLQPENLTVAGRNFGKLAFTGLLRNKDNNFRDIDRTTIAEFNRKWNIDSSVTTRSERILEMQTSYLPVAGFSLRGGLGKLTKSSAFAANRWDVQSSLNRHGLPRFDYFIERIDRNNRHIEERSDWLRQRGQLAYDLTIIKPMLQYEGEVRRDAQRDTLNAGFKFDSFTGGVDITPTKRLQATARYNVRDDKERVKGTFVAKSIARTQTYAVALKKLSAFSVSGSYTHRIRDFADLELQNTRTDLADFRLGYAPASRALFGNFYYQVSNTQVAKLEELYVEVDEGQGNYRFNEELAEFEPDALGNFTRIVVPTTDFVPVVELKTRFDLRLTPRQFFRGKGESGFSRLLSALSNETFLRVDERSSDEDVFKIYPFEANKFLQEATTVFGSVEVRNDFYLWRNSRKRSVRYRFRRRSELNNQLVAGGQKRSVLAHRVRFLHQFSDLFNVQIETGHAEEDRIFQEGAREDRRIRSDGMDIDFVYRPQQRLEVALKSKLSFNRDIEPSPRTEARLFGLAPRTTYAINTRGRILAEFDWTNVAVSPKDRLIPYELTQGNRAGATLRWNLTFEYRFTGHVQASLTYFGRSEPDRPNTQHVAKMEMRAFF
jgi:hypothetical protein